MLTDSFWDGVPPLDVIEYANAIGPDSPVARSDKGRDCEVQALCELYLARTNAGPEYKGEPFQSRVNTRRKFMGQWTDDNGPFTEEEVLDLRNQVRPWDFPSDFKRVLEEVFA